MHRLRRAIAAVLHLLACRLMARYGALYGGMMEEPPALPATWGYVNGKPFSGALPDGKAVAIPEAWKLPPEMRGKER